MKFLKTYFELIYENDNFHINSIKQFQVIPTQNSIIQTLLPLLRITEEAFYFAGTAGNKADINEYSSKLILYIDSLLYEENNDVDNSLESIKDQIKRLGYKPNIVDNEIECLWPIVGSEDKITLTIRLTDNLNWIKFSRYYPNLNKNESEYSGKYREAIISAIVESINKKIETYLDSNDNVKEYTKLIFNKDSGLYKITKSFEGKSGKLTTAYTMSNSEKLVTSDPNKFTKLIFGDEYISDNVMKFEDILDIIKKDNYIYKNKFKQITKRFYKNCNTLNIKKIEL